jgi:hypothetical protein
MRREGTFPPTSGALKKVSLGLRRVKVRPFRMVQEVTSLDGEIVCLGVFWE